MATVWRCSYESTIAGTSIVNTFHQVARGAPITGEIGADEVRDTLTAALNTKYRACLTPEYTLLSLTVREELAPGDTSIPQESVATIGLVGSLAESTPSLPYSLSPLVTIRTNAAVRSGHGRLFMPSPLSAGALTTGGLWFTTHAFWIAHTAFFTELNLNHNMGTLGSDGHLATIVYSRTRRAAGDPDYYFDMTGFIQRTKPHWLRSRATAP